MISAVLDVLSMLDAATDPTLPRRDILVAFDGACLGNPGPGGWGAVQVNQRTKSSRGKSGSSDGPTTNNRMELMAAIRGLETLTPGAYVTMLGDSQYVLKGITEWLPGWKRRGWRTAGGGKVANVELWERLEAAAARQAEVRWEWVRGHAGHELNERADRLAEKAARHV